MSGNKEIDRGKKMQGSNQLGKNRKKQGESLESHRFQENNKRYGDSHRDENKRNRENQAARRNKTVQEYEAAPGNNTVQRNIAIQGNKIIDENKVAQRNKTAQGKNKRLLDNKSIPGGKRAEKEYDDQNSKKREKSQKRQGNKQSGKNNNSVCPVVNKCGGCQLLHLDYAQQLKTKQKQIEALLGKFAKPEPIIGMEEPYHYRNKVHAVFDHDRKGNPVSGVYEAGTHRVVPVESCLLEDRQADAIIGTIRGMLKSFKIRTYDEDTDFGLLRHVLVRKGFHSGQIMVVLVLSSPILPSKNNFVKALLKQHPEITTIVINVNDKRTSMVLGEKEQVIYGKGFIEDSLCGKTFRISPKSFYQVNTTQTEILYGKAIELAGLTGKETVIDAYCGIGTISLIAAEHVKKVIGVELNPDAVRDANTNASRNKITNVDFYNKDAGEFMSQLAAQGESADLVFMDPPRTGSDERFLNSLCTLAPERIVYISCNPETLERDLKYLAKNKYKVQRMIPVDMFPGTYHVESIILLQHRNA